MPHQPPSTSQVVSPFSNADIYKACSLTYTQPSVHRCRLPPRRCLSQREQPHRDRVKNQLTKTDTQPQGSFVPVRTPVTEGSSEKMGRTERNHKAKAALIEPPVDKPKCLQCGVPLASFGNACSPEVRGMLHSSSAYTKSGFCPTKQALLLDFSDDALVGDISAVDAAITDLQAASVPFRCWPPFAARRQSAQYKAKSRSIAKQST